MGQRQSYHLRPDGTKSTRGDPIFHSSSGLQICLALTGGIPYSGKISPEWDLRERQLEQLEQQLEQRGGMEMGLDLGLFKEGGPVEDLSAMKALRTSQITLDGMRAVAEGLERATKRDLAFFDISLCQIDKETLVRCVRGLATNQRDLAELWLSSIHPQAIERLLADLHQGGSPLRNVTSLLISQTKLPARLELIRGFPALRCLSLPRCSLNSSQLQHVLNEFPSLKELVVPYNPLGSAGFGIVSDCLLANRFEVLDVGHCVDEVRKHDLHRLIQAAVSSSSIRKLGLDAVVTLAEELIPDLLRNHTELRVLSIVAHPGEVKGGGFLKEDTLENIIWSLSENPSSKLGDLRLANSPATRERAIRLEQALRGYVVVNGSRTGFSPDESSTFNRPIEVEPVGHGEPAAEAGFALPPAYEEAPPPYVEDGEGLGDDALDSRVVHSPSHGEEQIFRALKAADEAVWDIEERLQALVVANELETPIGSASAASSGALHHDAPLPELKCCNFDKKHVSIGARCQICKSAIVGLTKSQQKAMQCTQCGDKIHGKCQRKRLCFP